MERKSNRQTTQGRKFVDAAREAGTSEDAVEFDRALGKISKALPPRAVKERKAKKPTE